jgi:hypothetical protein
VGLKKRMEKGKRRRGKKGKKPELFLSPVFPARPKEILAPKTLGNEPDSS